MGPLGGPTQAQSPSPSLLFALLALLALLGRVGCPGWRGHKPTQQGQSRALRSVGILWLVVLRHLRSAQLGLLSRSPCTPPPCPKLPATGTWEGGWELGWGSFAARDFVGACFACFTCSPALLACLLLCFWLFVLISSLHGTAQHGTAHGGRLKVSGGTWRRGSWILQRSRLQAGPLGGSAVQAVQWWTLST